MAGLENCLGDGFVRATEAILDGRGRVIVSGVGKSGIVARKLAATLTSTGTPATFIHPVEAMHGDLGLVGPGDVAILLSKSGESEELRGLLEGLGRFGVVVVAMTGNRDSALARQADIVQLMPSNRGGATGLDPSQFSAPAIEEKVGWIRDAAGARFDRIELSAQLLECVVTDQPDEHLADFADRIATVTERLGGARIDLGEDELRKSPIVAVGSLDEVCERLVQTRDRYGSSYFAAPIDARPEALAPVIEALAGA